jgi:hypothetical protein
MAPWAMPTAWAPMVGRLRSRVCMAMVKPWPSSPIRWVAGTRTSSRVTSAGRAAPQAHLVLVGGHLDAPVRLDQEAADPLPRRRRGR